MRVTEEKHNFSAPQVGVPVTSLRFLFDGRRINDDETPKALEMEQVGGGFRFCWSSKSNSK